MTTLNEYFPQQMRDDDFQKAYEKLQTELAVIRALADARVARNMTQKELAERTGHQSGRYQQN